MKISVYGWVFGLSCWKWRYHDGIRVTQLGPCFCQPPWIGSIQEPKLFSYHFFELEAKSGL
jgi:hypothetical protein